jgi:hypothetical protein
VKSTTSSSTFGFANVKSSYGYSTVLTSSISREAPAAPQGSKATRGQSFCWKPSVLQPCATQRRIQWLTRKIGTVRGICSYQSTNYLFVTLFFQIPLCGNIERCLGFSVNRRWLKRMDHWGNKSCTEAFGIIHILYYLIRLLGWIIFYIMYTCSGHSMPLELWYE